MIAQQNIVWDELESENLGQPPNIAESSDDLEKNKILKQWQTLARIKLTPQSKQFCSTRLDRS